LFAADLGQPQATFRHEKETYGLSILVRRQRVLWIIGATVVTLLVAVWASRWHLSRVAVKVADPLVRAWVASHVLASSDSAYQITASSIRVDEAARRIAIDSITIVTDSAANARLARPHPIIALRFTHCELTGINLTALAAGRGLHATHAGCDSVSLLERTVVASIGGIARGAQDADSNNFLRFQGKLDLPAVLPFVAIDIVAFPHVHVAFDLIGGDAKRSDLAVDSLAVELDSVRIDPGEPVAKRRPLFSRDITVRLDRFSGQMKDGAHLSLEHLYADLEDGTCRLDTIAYEPSPGRRADSLGFAALHARRVTLTGVRWRNFLLTGAVVVGRLNIDTVLVRIVESRTPRDFHALPHAPSRIEATLRAVGRPVQLDSLAIMAVTVVEAGARTAGSPHGDAATTTLRRVSLGHLDFGTDDLSWSAPFPIGHVTLAIEGLIRRTSGMNTAVTRVMLDAGAQRIVMDSLRSAPEGDEAAFQRRYTYRNVRLTVAMAHVEANGVDLPAFLRRGALRTRALDVRGLVVTVMMDKSKPETPGPIVRRSPQAVIRDAATEIQVDTLTGAGLVTYREQDSTATTPGTLTFGAMRLRGYNFSTDPARMTAATPFRLIGDAMLMGVGPMHVEWNVPLLSRDLAMRWHGSLGMMDPRAMNSFLGDAVGMRFTGGTFEGAEWNVVVANGLARGKLSPRWNDMHVSLPGVARQNSGMLGGIMRGVAKLAANTFGIRSDNTSAGGHKPLDGIINHQWARSESLPEFIWTQLRDPLLRILMK
jgi:hypothetical protein